MKNTDILILGGAAVAVLLLLNNSGGPQSRPTDNTNTDTSGGGSGRTGDRSFSYGSVDADIRNREVPIWIEQFEKASKPDINSIKINNSIRILNGYNANPNSGVENSWSILKAEYQARTGIRLYDALENSKKFLLRNPITKVWINKIQKDYLS